MRIFLQGELNVGKSTAIRKTLDILSAQRQVTLGGFFTWKSDEVPPRVYMKPAGKIPDGVTHCIAGWDPAARRMVSDTKIFDSEGVRALRDCGGAQLMIMDELGALESGAPAFRQAVLDTLAMDIPVIGVIRLGDIPWLNELRRDTALTFYDVNKKNRDTLPRELAAILGEAIAKSNKELSTNHTR